MLLEEVFHSRLGNRRVVSFTIIFESSLHVFDVIVSAEDLTFWELSHARNKIFVLAFEDNNTTREDRVVLDVLVEAGLFTFGKFLLIFFNRFTFFVELLNLLHESVLGALELARETIKNVTTITAVILAQLDLQHFPKEFVGDAKLFEGDLDFGPAILRLFLFATLLLNEFFLGCFDLFELGDAGFDKLCLWIVLTNGFWINLGHAVHFINELFYVNARDVVVLG